ncbi:interferon regulatory factor 9 isoform X2 [Rhineura floridana]|nr:interferon regulatory factor 9 isoform X2 [Rhineura floridana]
MATSRRGVRNTRKLRQWAVEQVESGKFPGVVWHDPPHKTMFRIPWKHAGKQEFRHEEDAGFFKAWAIFKGKYQPGERLDPASWKTRIRCALSKSPEFEEVREHSQLGTAEPYKVYRLVPLPEQCLGSQSKARKAKAPRSETSNRSSGKGNGNPDGSVPQPTAALCNLKMESSSGSEALPSHAPSAFASLDVQNGETSPQPSETALADNEILLHWMPAVAQTVPVAEMGTENFVLLSVSYSGEVVLRHLLPEGEFLITSLAASPRTPASSMRRVVLPPPSRIKDPQKQGDTLRLLKDLERGVMAASNLKGIFIQCRGKASISWHGPQGLQPHGKLESNAYLQLFSTKDFKSALEEYRLGLRPLPEHQVTLCVGEELAENDHVDSKLIIIQMEQIFALDAVSPPGTLHTAQTASAQILLVTSGVSA